MRSSIFPSAIGSALFALMALANVSAADEGSDLLDLRTQVLDLRTAGRSREALPPAQRLAERAEQVFANQLQNLGVCVEALGLVYWDLGEYAKAAVLLQRVLSIREEIFGRNHSEVAVALSNLGLVYWNQGRYVEAEQAHRRALKIREQQLGMKHQEVGVSLNNLGLVLYAQGRYTEVEPLYLKCQAIWEETLIKDHPNLAMIYNNLANLFSSQSRYAEAERSYQRALAIREKLFGKDHPGVAATLNNLADLYTTQSRYAEADVLCRRALTLLEKSLGNEHPHVAVILNTLANLSARQGRPLEEVRFNQRALAIKEKTLGKEHPEVAKSLNNLALNLYYEGNYAEAKPLYQRALAILENAFDKEYVGVAILLDNLARLSSAQGEYAEAEQIFQRALTIREKAVGKDSLEVADTLVNMSESFFKQQQFAKAEPPAERAVAILDLVDAGAWDRFRGYSVRARLRWRMQKQNEAMKDLNHALDLIEQVRGQTSGGEAGLAQLFASSTFSEAYESMMDWQRELGNAGQVLTTIERCRARSLVDQLTTANIDLLAGVPADEATALHKRQATAKTALAQLEKQVDSMRADKETAEAPRVQKIKELESKLSVARDEVVQAYRAIRNASPVYRQMVGKDFKPSSLAEIQSRLVGADGLLLEHYLGATAGYVVIVPPAGNDARVELLSVSEDQGAVLGVKPGPLTETRMRAILSNEAGTGLLQQLRNASKAEAMTGRLAALWQVLVPETERKLLVEGQLKRCIVIPDAALAAFPFDTLVVEPGEPPKYWLDVGPPIVTAPSATLLMNLSESKANAEENSSNLPKKSALLSVADPNYGVPSVDAGLALVELSARSRYGVLRGDLKSLPFTGWECSWVTETFRKAGFDAGALQKAGAREASVRMYAPGRKYLHFACHGLVDQSHGNLFGALALTPGPNGAADPADDGFLTLAEIYELNLRGTELSILSACDTNFGPNQRGEGAWSLSRGFLVAGSKRVIASNWLVDDEAGASLISVFCSSVVKGKQSDQLDYAAGLQAAKRWVRGHEKWKSPYFWGTFVLVGPY